jgi:hypothetical protein
MSILVIIGVSLHLTRSRNRTVTLPLLGKVDVLAFRLLLPAALILVWLQFGFLFHATINQRISLFISLSAAGEPKESGKSKDSASVRSASTATQDLTAAGEPKERSDAVDGTLYSTLNDGGLLDLWFRSFWRDYVRGLPDLQPWKDFTWYISVLTYGIILGALHGVLLALLYDDEEHWYWWLAYLVPSVALIAISHFQFAFAGGNKNSFQYVVVFLGWAIFFGLCELRLRRQGADSPRK